MNHKINRQQVAIKTKRIDLSLAHIDLNHSHVQVPNELADLGLVEAMEMKVEVAQITQMTLKRATMKAEVTRVTIPGRRKRKREKKM